MYSSMTTICLLPGIAASLLPFHRDFRSSCAIFRRPRKPQKRRPDGFTTVYSCESSASCAARRRPPENRKKAPGWVLPNPALRGFRRRFRRPREPQKRRPDGFTKIQPCGIFGPPVVTFRRPAVKLQKRRPGGFSKIQPCEASVVVFALPASTEGNCLSLAKQGEFARMDAKKACENDRKRSRWIGRTRPGAGGTGAGRLLRDGG